MYMQYHFITPSANKKLMSEIRYHVDLHDTYRNELDQYYIIRIYTEKGAKHSTASNIQRQHRVQPNQRKQDRMLFKRQQSK